MNRRDLLKAAAAALPIALVSPISKMLRPPPLPAPDLADTIYLAKPSDSVAPFGARKTQVSMPEWTEDELVGSPSIDVYTCEFGDIRIIPSRFVVPREWKTREELEGQFGDRVREVMRDIEAQALRS